MVDIYEIQLEERNENAAIKWGIIIFLYSIILTFVFDIPIFSMPNQIIAYGISTVVGLLYISTWVIHIITFIWIVNIAKKLNRPAFTWGIFGLVFPWITLIIIGLQDYKVEDKNIKEIIDKVRFDFRAEVQHLKSSQDLSENELNQKKLDLKEKYNIALRKKVGDYIAKERDISTESVDQEEKVPQFQFEPEEIYTTQGESENWIHDSTKCPACGAKIDNKMTVCYDCGLTIK